MDLHLFEQAHAHDWSVTKCGLVAAYSIYMYILYLLVSIMPLE